MHNLPPPPPQGGEGGLLRLYLFSMRGQHAVAMRSMSASEGGVSPSWKMLGSKYRRALEYVLEALPYSPCSPAKLMKPVLYRIRALEKNYQRTGVSQHCKECCRVKLVEPAAGIGLIQHDLARIGMCTTWKYSGSSLGTTHLLEVFIA